MVSISDSLNASIIIQHQLRQQIKDKQGALQQDQGGDSQQSNSRQIQNPGEDEEKGVGICLQLMLVAALFGIEMCISFEQIYEILIGGAVAHVVEELATESEGRGGSSMIFLPIVGSWVDGGKSPRMRKLFSLSGGMAVFLSGLVLLIIASLLKVQQLEDIIEEIHNETAILMPWLNIREANDIESAGNSNITPRYLPDGNKISPPLDDPHFQESGLDVTSLPGIVFLSIAGFACIDYGFDACVSLSRALILENVPKFQHMSVLLLATIVQSSAGTLCAVIGCFDLPGTLGLAFRMDGTAATIIFFCCIIIFATFIGFFLMNIGSYRLGKRIQAAFGHGDSSLHLNKGNSFSNTSQVHSVTASFNANVTQSEETEVERIKSSFGVKGQRDAKRKPPAGQLQQVQEGRPYIPDILHTEEGDTSTRPLLLEDSLKVNYSALNTAVLPVSQDNRQQQVSSVNDGDEPYTPATSASSDTERAMDSSTAAPSRVPSNTAFDSTGVSTVLDAVRQSYSLSMSQRGALGEFHARKLTLLRQAKSRLNSQGRAEKQRQSTKKMVILCVSSFFAIGSAVAACVYSSNALNRGILHGDPTALPGTEGRMNYERGLQMSAIGNLILYASFMVVSLGNTKIIDVIGEMGQYVLFHVIMMVAQVTVLSEMGQYVLFHVFMMVALVTVLSTQLMEVYFIYMVFTGCYRTCMLTLPFVLAHKFAQEALDAADVDAEQKVSQTGKLMALIGFLIPTHNMILSMFLGPLMDVTGSPWIPLFYSLGTASLSLGVFSLLFFI
ncbi:hypothetical protein PoB_003404400 [Plakobranchus ocellatus]|uniref:Uncharacterized protein n=1 Tax=Plakobranchus ocellatus TaxID=259542 RepID=A0AAV4AME3_9GAST|nr:hypothetical protein PoB_003404400 [Plakobranchus ocellatus]